MKPSLPTIISDQKPETENATITVSPTTIHPGPKRKLDLTVTNSDRNNTTTRNTQKQCVIQDFYTSGCWYNKPAFSHNINLPTTNSLSLAKLASLSLNLESIQHTTMSSTNSALTQDAYLELATTLSHQTSLGITVKMMQLVDALLAQERQTKHNKLAAGTEPNAKRIKNAVIGCTEYKAIAELAECSEPLVINLIDQALQHHRLNIFRNTTAIDLTGATFDQHDKPAAPAGVTVSPLTAAAASTEQALVKVETNEQEPQITKPKAQVSLFQNCKTFSYQATPTSPTSTNINSPSFLKTIDAVYQKALKDLTVHCEYIDNPRATLVFILGAVGASVPNKVLDAMFAKDLTMSPNTIESIFKQHNVTNYLQFKDYSTEVANANLCKGIYNLFAGHSGNNFGGDDGFSSNAPILCQMEMSGPANATNNKSYQWTVFFPHMNAIVTCNNTLKHAWILGRNVIEALHTRDDSKLNRCLGKLIFPHKSDNVQALTLVSAVFIAPKKDNFVLK
jgi:hypothetical protein